MESLDVREVEWWKQRRVLVTGATGMVGSWVVRELLRRGAYVVAFVLDVDNYSELERSGMYRRIHVANGNIDDFRAIERAVLSHECDSVLHLAAQAIVTVAERSPLATFETNVRGTWNILEVCRIHKALVNQAVVASSDKAYGDHANLTYTEDTPLLGKEPYEASKTCADIVAQSYSLAYDLPIAIARCGNIYGGGDINWSRIVPSTIRSFYNHEPPMLRSDGKFVRDYIYVEDVASAYLSLMKAIAANSFKGEAFNFSNESRVTVLEVVETIAELMNCQEIKPRILNVAHREIRQQHLSAEKARRLLNWKPRFNLRRGLELTIPWYLKLLAEMDG